MKENRNKHRKLLKSGWDLRSTGTASKVTFHNIIWSSAGVCGVMRRVLVVYLRIYIWVEVISLDIRETSAQELPQDKRKSFHLTSATAEDFCSWTDRFANNNPSQNFTDLDDQCETGRKYILLLDVIGIDTSPFRGVVTEWQRLQEFQWRNSSLK